MEPTETFVVGTTVSCRVAAESVDAAFAALLRDVQPRIEVSLGLAGFESVRFEREFAKRPVGGEN